MCPSIPKWATCCLCICAARCAAVTLLFYLQDVASGIKRSLSTMLPGVRVFLECAAAPPHKHLALPRLWALSGLVVSLSHTAIIDHLRHTAWMISSISRNSSLT